MSRPRKLALISSVFVLALSLLLPGISRADAPATQPCVSVMAMGDWGDGGKGQKAVAEELATFAAKQVKPVDAMLLAGDNFYVPLSSINDPTWQNLFEDMYDIKRLPMPFYASLGNHDYPDNKFQIEIDYSRAHPESRWKMPARWYRVDLPADHPLVSILVLDSNKDGKSADSPDHLSPEMWDAQMKFIETELAKPHDGVWTVAMAHHPLFSNGSHGDTGPLTTTWGPLFKKYNLDFYICGHDHDLQHLQLDGWKTSFLLVGGGGKSLTVMRRDNRGPFSRSIMGFANIVFTPDTAEVRYIDRDGNELHHFTRTRDGTVTILNTTGMDKPTGHPLKAIEQGN